MAKIPKALHCKKAVLTNQPGTLQAVLTASLDSRQQINQRLENVGSSHPATRFRVIGQYYPVKKALGGILVSYEPGSKAASLINDPSANQMTLDHFSAPTTSAGQAREWVEGMLFFLVIGDYLVFIQSASVRQDQLEEHLGWLLTGTSSNPVVVTLNDKPPSNVEKLIQRHHVKSLVLDGALMSGSTETTAGRESVKLEGPMLEMLKGALKGHGHGFRWNDGLEGNLEARLELTFKRSTTEPAQRLLDNVATTLRNLDGVDCELILGNGDKITRDQLRLTTKRNIEAKDGVLSPMSAFDQMYLWIESLANTGQL
ncbi:MAG: hypothetical protein FDZ72_11625 [Betaproteobacteria bacterium]|nr:MAG: hypothetical protein FDZ72_11625 [Betaproteobacteria bacterium]